VTGGFAVSLALLVAGSTGEASERIALGDAAYARFDNEAALARYLEAVELDPDEPEALWRAARAHADVGKALEARDKREAKAAYQRGEGLARRAVERAPDSANAHFALALCVGRLALFAGGKTKIRLSKEVRIEAERAIALDPLHDGAHHLMGRWHYAIARLGWLLKAFAEIIYGGVPPDASLEAAAEHFARAIEIDDRKPVHRLEYARVLLKLGHRERARDELRRCVELTPVLWDDAESQAEAARLLEELAP
jgi:tetratricopeptide (TPR) repeat protein